MLLFLFLTKKKNTALAKMFSVELKFTTDCLKNWFSRKHKILDVELKQKIEFLKKKPIKKPIYVAYVIFH